jgi:homoserine kinase type II
LPQEFNTGFRTRIHEAPMSIKNRRRNSEMAVQPSHEEIEKILCHWQLKLHRLRPDIEITGSPERTEYRTVLEDETSALWLLEKIPHHLYSHKLGIIRLLDRLRNSGMEGIEPYFQNETGAAIVSHEKTSWQMIPFISGIPLNRPAYVMEAWRGTVMAQFLTRLKVHTLKCRPTHRSGIFSITDYISALMKTIAQQTPELIDPLTPIVSFINSFLAPIMADLPVHLCHGDYHPLNIIWGENRLLRVIDWEFYGFKPEAYDAANMVGCLGMEDPAALSGPLVRSFLDTLNTGAFMSPISRKHFLALILAIRFGWLSEWLRKKDTEMIHLELTYMYLLMDNRRKIETMWR